MKTFKLKVKLPEEITLNIPTFSDVELDEVMPIIASKGKDFIKDTIEREFMEAFVKKHSKLIGNVVKRLVDEKEEEILELLEVNKLK